MVVMHGHRMSTQLLSLQLFPHVQSSSCELFIAR